MANLKKPLTGFVKVEYLEDLGTHSKGEKDVLMHASTAKALGSIVKVTKKIDKYIPAHAKL